MGDKRLLLNAHIAESKVIHVGIVIASIISTISAGTGFQVRGHSSKVPYHLNLDNLNLEPTLLSFRDLKSLTFFLVQPSPNLMKAIADFPVPTKFHRHSLLVWAC